MQTEVVQFIGAMIMFLGILVGSYWFVYAPIKRGDRRAQEEQKMRDQH